MTRILVLYYSAGGKTRQLAQLIARGIEEAGAEALLRTVPGVSAQCEATHPSIPTDGDLYAEKQDLLDCDGLIVGSPARFGNMAAPLKYFFDQTSELWMNGGLADKPVSVFSSSSSMHGGQESTLLTMMIPFLHHGMLICGLPYRETELMHTETGGTPYGVTHWAGSGNTLPISHSEKKLALAQGRRTAEMAKRLKYGKLEK